MPNITESIRYPLRAACRRIARTVANYSRGRHELELGPTLIDTPLPETQAARTRQPKILKARMAERSNADFEASLAELKAAFDRQDEAAVRKILFDVIETSAG